MNLRLSAHDVIRFANWSKDRNPLHTQPDFARETFFGRTIAHGMLTVAEALRRVRHASDTRLTTLDIDFSGAIVPDADYRVRASTTETTLTVDVADGQDRRVLTLQSKLGDLTPAAASTDRSWVARAAASGVDNLTSPQDWQPHAFRPGVEVVGTYRTDHSDGVDGIDALSKTQLDVLGLCSYVVGMRLPGLRSLFTHAHLTFFAHPGDTDDLRYRARVVRFDRHFRLLDIALEIAGASGDLVATAELRGYVPFSPKRQQPEELAHHVGRGAMAGKIALVCGGSRGLGADLSAALALAGAQVYSAARSGVVVDQRTLAIASERGGTITPLGGDVGDAVWCEHTIESIRQRHGRLDLLVLNACAPPSAMRVGRETAARQHEYVVDNLRLVESPLAASLPLLDDSGGTVVYISSSFVQQPPAGFGHYVALKLAAEGLVQTAFRERPDHSVLIARPPRLQTTWNDTPTGVAGAIASETAAARIVARLDDRWGAGQIDTLADFPALERPVDDADDGVEKPAEFTLALTASFTTDALVPGLRFWLKELGDRTALAVSPYGQVLQTLLDPASVFSTNKRGMNVVLLRVLDWLRELSGDQAGNIDFLRGYLADTARDFERAVRAHRSRSGPETLLLICPSYGATSSAESILIRQTEGDLIAALSGVSGLQIARASDFHGLYSVNEDEVNDPVRDDIAHIPYRDPYLRLLSTIVARRFHARTAPVRKVVVVDCDNTLWGGVVGEVGAEGIEFSPAHAELHEALVRLASNGILICLCSKNEEPDVWSVFETRPDFGLRREHVVAAMINWQAKSENLRTLAARLNLGLDSFIFIDDNPIECAEVRSRCPEVLTLQWPQDPDRARLLLQHTWELDITKGTSEDARRTELYREEFRRQELRDQTLTFSDFLNSLDLVTDIAPLAAADLKRAAQLTMRTNQFNFTTRRRDEAEVQALVDAGTHDVRTVRVKDRFGDYGLVGLFILEHGAPESKLDTFLLSCRVLGRGVEHRMAAEIGRLAAAAGASSVTMRIDFTKRNTPARTFLESIAHVGTLRTNDKSMVCEFGSLALAELRFEPTGDPPVIAETTESAPAAGTRIDGDDLRRREEQIGRTAFVLSQPELLRAAIDGRTESATATSAVAAEDVMAVVCDAFAATLRVPVDVVKRVNRLEALGCDSLKIVEITVALLEKFPDLPSTLLFEHRSVDQIVKHIAALAGRRPDAASVVAPIKESAPARRASTDVAVVGMHVRCAGASSPAELWELLRSGRSAVTPVPVDREHFLHPLSDSRPHWAGLLTDVDRFDPEFFGVSPREAAFMDPQLRLFLEVAWAAIEDAGCAGADHESNTGVFAGVMYGDYGYRANQHSGDGNLYRCWEGFSLANRLSQLLGFHGPSLAVDTACSSSGTALHLACRSVLAGECRIAVVGGVNLILDPDRFASLGRLGILTPTGHCQPFGDEADGTVLGEGAGVVVLRALDDAIARGDRIYGVIKGTAISTGTGTVGFTAPNPQSQSEAIRRCLESAAVDPRTISYVETHGTGTALGDPIEVRGLQLAYTDPQLHDRELTLAARCRIGSIKPNIGHLEAGAGVVGLIKVLLQLQHGVIAPSITSPQPNRQIPFADLPFEIQRGEERWERPQARLDGVDMIVPRRAGLSSFGVGGSNAHVIVEEAPAAAAKSPERIVDRPVHIVALSARNEDSLKQQIGAVRDALHQHQEISLGDAAHSLNTGRRHFEHRLAVTAPGRERLIETLGRLAGQRDRVGVTVEATATRKIAFLFTGQGSQYAGMGKPLYDAHPIFRAALDRAESSFNALLGQSLLDVLFRSEPDPVAAQLNQTGFTQPALFAFEYALATLWQSWGIQPDVVMGHSVGELAAMCIAGGLSLDDGLKLVAARGRLMQSLPPGGSMTSVMAGERDVLEAIAGREDRVAIAAINGPGHVVISGAAAAVAEIAERFNAGGVKTKALTVSHAFHSPLMKPMVAEYAAVLREIKFSSPRVPLVTCVDGVLASREITQPEYWLRQVLEPVRFTTAMATLEQHGATTYLEIGPQPVLLGMGQHCVANAGARTWLPSMRRDVEPWSTLLGSLATLYEQGADIDWKAFDAPYRRTRVAMPAYAFRKRRYWIDVDDAARPARSTIRRPPEDASAANASTYEVAWRRTVTPQASASADANDKWLVVSTDGKMAEAIARSLQQRGLAADVLAGVDALAAKLPRESQRCRVVYVADGADVAAAIAPAIACIRALAAKTSDRHRLWFVTRAAMAVDSSSEQIVNPAHSALWGLGRTAALEHPDFWAGLIDLEATPSLAAIDSLVVELVSSTSEDQVALRDGNRFVARLVPAAAPAALPVALDGDGVYLITGGVGAIGQRLARWLAAQGARHLLLASRHASAERARDLVRDLEQLGTETEVVAADVSSPRGIDALFTRVAGGSRPLRGIIHAAGIDAVAPIGTVTTEQIRDVIASKAAAAWHLHERSRQMPLDFFIGFSSMSAVTGSAGRAVYGAANAFLDGLAHERRRLGLSALTINWGPWAGGGMATEKELAEYGRVGNRALDPDRALAMLGGLMQNGTTQATVVDIDWATFRPAYESRRPRPLVTELGTSNPAGDAPSADRAPTWMTQLSATAADHRGQLLTELLRGELAEALGFEQADDVRTDRTFSEMGVDSLLAAEFANRLQKRLGIASIRLVFDYPTVEALAAHLSGQLAVTDAAVNTSVAPVTPALPASGIEGYSAAAEPDVVEFQKIAFPDRRPDLILDRWRWMFVDSARRLGVEPRVWLHRDAGRIVGHMGAIPVRLKLGSDEVSTAWLVDTMVLDDYRGQAVGSRLMVQAHDDVPFALSLGQTPEMREIQYRLGWKQVSPLQTAQFLIRPERVLKGKLPAPAALAAGFGMRATTLVRDLVRQATRVAAREISRFDDRHDRLWQLAARDVGCAIVRDASYLNWKYVDQPGQAFVRLEVADDTGVKGVAVFTVRDRDDVYKYRRALLVDLVSPVSDARSLQALLQATCEAAGDHGADAVECLHISSQLTRGLKQAGFFVRAPQRFLLVDPGPLSEMQRQTVLSAESWFVTQGDSDIDRP